MKLEPTMNETGIGTDSYLRKNTFCLLLLFWIPKNKNIKSVVFNKKEFVFSIKNLIMFLLISNN